MAVQRVVIFDPAGRAADELCGVAARVGISLQVVTNAVTLAAHPASLLLVPVTAVDAVVANGSSVPRWVYGDVENSAKLASAAITCAASGVLMLPTRPESVQMLCGPPTPNLPEVDLARARSLIATSVLDGNGEPTPEGLAAIARCFAADDAVLWWREGENMQPWGTRTNTDADQAVLGAAARVSAATGLTVLAATSHHPLAIAAAPLATGPQVVAGLIAVVADRARRFSAGEVADLRALAARLPRELTFRAGHRRLVAEHERLAAGATIDPLTGLMSRSAFDSEVAASTAAATRRGESLSLAVFDVVGLRRINLEHGHKAGDEVLAAVASRIRAHTRGSDKAGRFGGDEIAVIYMATDANGAECAARKMVAHIAATTIPTGEGDIAVEMRAAVTALAPGERSGEAAFARLQHAVRSVAPSEVACASSRIDNDAVVDERGITTGTTLGGAYRILHELSRGAMGVVYRGEDLGLGRQVAIKVLRSDLASNAALVGKFRAEAAMLASLHHPNLVQVFSLGEHQGDVYFVMELVEGQSLAEVLETQHNAGQWLPFEAIAQIAIEIGDALSSMHAIGLIHRDVKPANVLLDRERDRAVLVDVGVAKRHGDEVDGAGTPGFAAPESFLEGSTESAETDVYGLAATMFCALTGRPPYGAGQLMQVITRQLHDPLTPASSLRPGLTPAIDEVMAKALAPDQTRRFTSASAFGVALARALERAQRPTGQFAPQRPIVADPVVHPPSIVTELVEQPAPAAVMRQTEIFTGKMRPNADTAPHAGMIRAAHFRVAGRVIAHLAGDATVRSLCESSADIAEALATGASPMGWLPLRLLCELSERAAMYIKRATIAEAAEQLIRAIGRSTISATFPRFFGADPVTLGVAPMLAVLPSVWNRYHGWCRITSSSRRAPGEAEVILIGEAPPLALHLVSAQLAKACELAAANSVNVQYAAVGHEHQFVIQWAT